MQGSFERKEEAINRAPIDIVEKASDILRALRRGVLVTAKAGPGLLARLPNIINGTEFQKMSSTVFMFMADLEKGFALPDISDNAAAKNILDNHGLMSSFLQACVEDGLGITLPSVPQIEVDPQEDAVSYMLDTLKASVEAR
ncbi:MAG: hypothetical protein IKO55_08610 [Kiritimatiellae bacterium]|nr:hypothetical protein [Kiritimatiellia bacterium]